MKCIVFQCKNQLTEWELGKINPIKFSKFRMCKYCRTYNKDELRECTCGKPFQGGGMSLYCDDCKQARKDEYDRNRPKMPKEKQAEYNRRYYLKHGPRKKTPQTKEKQAEYHKKYYLKVTKVKRMMKKNNDKRINKVRVSN